jgi:hypothetical protein
VMKKAPTSEKNNVFCILCQAKIKAVKVPAHAAKLAEKDSKCKEKDCQQKMINKPSSAKKPRSTKKSAHIIRELHRIAAFQAQFIIFTKVQKTSEMGID